jgi:hypothetical protein
MCQHVSNRFVIKGPGFAIANVLYFIQVVLDLEDPPFSRLFHDNSWIESEEAYRKQIVDFVPTSRKAYLWEIRHSIINYCLKHHSAKTLWIFSLRTNQCQLLIIP